MTPEYLEKINFIFTLFALGKVPGCLSIVLNSPITISKPSAFACVSVRPAAAKAVLYIFVEKALIVPLFSLTNLN